MVIKESMRYLINEVHRKKVANLELKLISVTYIAALFFSENLITLYKKTNPQFLKGHCHGLRMLARSVET